VFVHTVACFFSLTSTVVFHRTLSCSELRELLKTAGKKYPHLALVENYFQCDPSSLKGLMAIPDLTLIVRTWI
jgi:hypothetical protein